MNPLFRPALAVSLLLLAPACTVPLDPGDGGTGGGTGGGGGTVPGGETVTVPTTWAATPAACDAVVSSELHVKAALTVAPGATVCFEPGAGLLVEETGSLTAEGTAAAPISFVGTVATAGSWKGISLASTNAANRFSHVTFAHAGNADSLCCGIFLGGEDIQGALILGDNRTGGLVSVEDSVFTDIAAHGVFMFPDAKFGSFARNRFERVAKAPVTATLETAQGLDLDSVYAGAGNGQPFIRLLPTPVENATTLRGLPVPYVVAPGTADKTVQVRAALTLEAGARLEFEANCGMIVEETASLTAAGTAGKHVVLTGRSPTPGFWKGLAVTGLTNTLTYTDLSYGGNADPLCCGFFEGGTDMVSNLVVGDSNTAAAVTLTNVTSTQGGGRGVGALHGSTVVQAGVNDLTTGNAQPNSGL